MWHEESLSEEFFARLSEIDEEIAVRVAAVGCPVCGVSASFEKRRNLSAAG